MKSQRKTPITRRPRINARTRDRIVRLYAQGKHSQQALAKLCGCSQATVCRIIGEAK